MDRDESCRLEVWPATPADEAIVREILDDVRRWLAERGIAQWTSPFGDTWIAGTIAAGEFHVGHLRGAPVAVARLLWADPRFWGEWERGDAVYLHTMAVRRDCAGRGIGACLLDWAGEQGKRRGRQFLRLDCGEDNPALVAYYRRRGFRPRGSARVGGESMMLFEKDLEEEQT